MIGIPMNPNSIHVSTVQTGCWKAGFCSAYPIHLNGIIGREEYQESISKINRIMSSSAPMLYALYIIFMLITISGILCSLIGGITGVNTRKYGFPSLTGVGNGLIMFGSMFFIFGLLIISYQQTARMREAITEESMKYSSRSTPCSWRLETTIIYFGGNENKTGVNYHLVIDIGRSTAPGSEAYYPNQFPNESSSLFSEQKNNYAPPPYSVLNVVQRDKIFQQDFVHHMGNRLINIKNLFVYT